MVYLVKNNLYYVTVNYMFNPISTQSEAKVVNGNVINLFYNLSGLRKLPVTL